MKKKLLYGLGAIFAFILFYSIIPLDIYDTFFYFLIIVGGALTAICTGGFIFSFEKSKDQDGNANFGCLTIGAVLFVFFGSSFLFLFHEGEREEAELEKYGVLTEARVVDGSSFATRKADFTHLTLQFKTEKGQLYTTNYSIGAGEFNNFYQSQTIPIVYSPRYPQILKIFRNMNELQEYMQKQEEKRR